MSVSEVSYVNWRLIHTILHHFHAHSRFIAYTTVNRIKNHGYLDVGGHILGLKSAARFSQDNVAALSRRGEQINKPILLCY